MLFRSARSGAVEHDLAEVGVAGEEGVGGFGLIQGDDGVHDGGDPTGGERKIVSNLEVLFPMPGMTNDKSIRLSAFVDGGIIGSSYDFSQARYSAGLAVSYVSPFGPLKFSFAQPIRSFDGDKLQKVQFQFGQQF